MAIVREKYNDLLEFLRLMAWGGSISLTLVIVLLRLQPSSDEIRKNGIYHEGVVTELHSTLTGHYQYFVHAKINNEKIVSIEVTTSSWRLFHIGEHVKIWEYRGGFYIDEYDNMKPNHLFPFIMGDILCIMAIMVVHLKRKGTGGGRIRGQERGGGYPGGGIGEIPEETLCRIEEFD